MCFENYYNSIMYTQIIKDKTVTVDDEDAHFLQKYLHGWVDKRGYVSRKINNNIGKRTTTSLHREIMNAITGQVVDFRDDNPNNCQKSNLRICIPAPTPRENIPITHLTIDKKTTVIHMVNDSYALIDSEDYTLVSQYKYISVKDKNRICAFSTSKIKGNGRFMHRIIMGISGPEIDHKNHNAMDNRKINLRHCTHQQNMCNQDRTDRTGCTSKYKGVSFNRKTQLWRAVICLNYKITYLGGYRTQEEARDAYDLASKELHGEFGLTNDTNPKQKPKTVFEQKVRCRYRGVYRNHSGSYQAAITRKRKHYNCGTFQTEEEAASAYLYKLLELEGV